MTAVENPRQSDTIADQLVIEYFRALRTEIDLRIRNHTTLVTAKVVTSGGILAFMLRECSGPEARLLPCGLILVPVIAMLYDLLIAKNIQNINRMGMFIRDKIEPIAVARAPDW